MVKDITRGIEIDKYWKTDLDLKDRWYKLMEGLHINNPPSENLTFHIFADLLLNYSDSFRHYHTEIHLLDCLRELDVPSPSADSPPSVETALWFHDVIYDPKAHINEELSADYAGKELKKLGLDHKFIDYIKKLVLITKHNSDPEAIPETIDEKLVVDIDLSIFGQPENVFDEYERNIRKEYQGVTEEDFRKGRSKILEGFLKRNSIYYTDFFVCKYETFAQRNLERSLRNLRIEAKP